MKNLLKLTPAISVRFLRAALGLAAFVGLPAVAGCKDPPAPPAEAIPVVATVYALGDIVRQVGGEQVKVEWLIEAGDALGPLEDTPARRRQFSRAGLIVTRGQLDALRAFENDERFVRIDTLPAARHADLAHFLWLDPRVALELADVLAARLAAIEPKHGERFRANAVAFSREVAELMEQTTIRINRHGRGGFATLDPRFTPLAQRFGVSPIRLPEVPLNDPTENNANAVRFAAEAGGAKAVFMSDQTPFTMRRAWESRLGLPVLTLADAGSSSAAGHSTYLELLRHNLAQLAHGIAPTTVPAEVAPPSTPQESPAAIPLEPATR